jgi:hypothetical protein
MQLDPKQEPVRTAQAVVVRRLDARHVIGQDALPI